MKNILLISLAFLCLASCSNSEVDEAMQANKPSMETRVIATHQEWKINGTEQKIALSTNGERAGFQFYATGNVYLTDHITGTTYHISEHSQHITGGPGWALSASGHGTLYADMAAFYNNAWYSEGEVIYRKFDENGNVTEVAVVHNGLVTILYPN